MHAMRPPSWLRKSLLRRNIHRLKQVHHPQYGQDGG